MILSLILSLFYFFILIFSSILPPAEVFPLPLEIHDAIAQITGAMHGWNLVLPISEALDALAFVLAAEFFILSFKFINWAFKKLTFSG